MQGFTRDNRGIEGITRVYKDFQGITRDSGIFKLRIIEDYRGIRGLTRDLQGIANNDTRLILRKKLNGTTT